MDSEKGKRVGQERRPRTGLSHAQVFGGFQRGAAFATDDRAAVATD